MQPTKQTPTPLDTVIDEEKLRAEITKRDREAAELRRVLRAMMKMRRRQEQETAAK